MIGSATPALVPEAARSPMVASFLVVDSSNDEPESGGR